MSHTVMVLNLFIKEVKGITKSSLYLVELASINHKSRKDGKKFAEQSVVEEQFNVLMKVLQGLASTSGDIPPYGESHLTRVLKDLIAPKNRLVFMAHILQD